MSHDDSDKGSSKKDRHRLPRTARTGGSAEPREQHQMKRFTDRVRVAMQQQRQRMEKAKKQKKG